MSLEKSILKNNVKKFYAIVFCGLLLNVQVTTDDDPNSITAGLRKKLTSDDPDLTTHERLQIRQVLEAYPQDEWVFNFEY